MTLELTVVTDIKVYLPSSWEQSPLLDLVLAKCLTTGADETSTIGPWVCFGACEDENEALQIVRDAVAKVESEELFNCWTPGQEPDWTAFDWLALGGCVTLEEGEPGEHTQGGEDRDTAQFFTVYGHIPNAGHDAITDIMSFDRAQEIGALLASRSGLELKIEC